LGSTFLVTSATGLVVSQTQDKVLRKGRLRYQSGTQQTNDTYAGQYSYTADFGLMYYNARWYDPALGRFAQADTIVPAGVQGYDRYAYVNNNPLRYTDPSGHSPSEGCGEEGRRVCHASDLEQATNAQKLATLQQEASNRNCAAGNENYCSGWANGIGRPITGTHTGTSVTADFFYGKYYYEQTDVLYDWMTGTKYTTLTVTPVEGTYVGTPNGVSVEFYRGSTFIFGIPLSATANEVKEALGGPNSDHAFDLGGEVLPEIGVNSGFGFSKDLNEAGMPIITTAGSMFAFETKIGGGASALPSPWVIEGGGERGRSITTVISTDPIPWWPFK